MQTRHRVLLSYNHEFLVNEMPMDAMLDAMRDRRVLTWHDLEQLKTLRHQGRRALARYFLAVLPHRGARAFSMFLESLQAANAQHLVDLLLQQAGVTNLDDLLQTPPPHAETGDQRKHGPPPKTPTDTPLPAGPDPHEYALKLTRNADLIREFVDPAHVCPLLVQNKVITPREADMVVHLHGRDRKWDLIMAALLQRGDRAYQAFMAALLQKDYPAMFHTIQETSTEPSDGDEHIHEQGTGSQEHTGEDGVEDTKHLRAYSNH